MYRTMDKNQTVAKKIWHDYLQCSTKPFSWGLNFNSVKVIEDGTAFHVQGMVCGWIKVQQLTDMKKFVIHYNYYATVDVTVLANSKEEAIEKADQIEFDNNDFELDFESREAFDEGDVPDLQDLITKASNIIKDYKSDEPFKVLYYPTVTTRSWDGEKFENQHNTVEDFYWDEEKGLMMDVGEGFEVGLTELSDIEQLEVCQVIINAAPSNGIEA